MPPRDRIDTLVERIEDSDDIGDADREVLRMFDQRLNLLAQNYSDHRHEKLLRHCVIMAEQLESGLLAAALEDREAAERIVGWINRTYSNEETNRDYRSALRVFGKRIAERRDVETDRNGMPVSLSWVPTGTSSTYDPTPDPREMLHWDDHVKPMANEASYSRDAAMIALQFDAGLRGGEFKSLQVGDIMKHRHGLQVTVDGKQGQRTVLLIPSVPYISRWLEDHPGKNDPNAPLWSKLNHAEGISDRMVYDIFEKCADRAGVERPVTLTNFRKSSAAFLASRNLNQAHIEDHHGWVRGSNAAARYISVFGEDSDRELARLHGKDVSDEEPEDISPIKCPTCERENAHDATLCDRCGQALDHRTAVELDKIEVNLQQLLAELDPEEALEIMQLSDAFRAVGIRREIVEREVSEEH